MDNKKRKKSEGQKLELEHPIHDFLTVETNIPFNKDYISAGTSGENPVTVTVLIKRMTFSDLLPVGLWIKLIFDKSQGFIKKGEWVKFEDFIGGKMKTSHNVSEANDEAGPAILLSAYGYDSHIVITKTLTKKA